MRFPRTMLLAGLMAFATAQADSLTSPTRPDYVISSAGLLDRAHRVLRVSQENARTWYAGLANLNDWPALLERSLLEALGPDSVRSRELGLGPLRKLLEEPTDSIQLSPEARQILTLLVHLLERQTALTQRSEELAEALERERLAHLETLKKLAALREIDDQIEQRDSADDSERGTEP